MRPSEKVVPTQKDMADGEGKSRETYMNGKKHGCEEQESKFNRLRDAGEERSQGDRDQERSGFFAFFGFCAAVHGERCADRKSTRLNSSHIATSRMPSSA